MRARGRGVRARGGGRRGLTDVDDDLLEGVGELAVGGEAGHEGEELFELGAGEQRVDEGAIGGLTRNKRSSMPGPLRPLAAFTNAGWTGMSTRNRDARSTYEIVEGKGGAVVDLLREVSNVGGEDGDSGMRAASGEGSGAGGEGLDIVLDGGELAVDGTDGGRHGSARGWLVAGAIDGCI